MDFLVPNGHKIVNNKQLLKVRKKKGKFANLLFLLPASSQIYRMMIKNLWFVAKFD
jgi:hypothetical protein